MKKVFLFLVVAATLFACNDTKKKALEFNNKIAGYSRELQTKGFELGQLLGTAANTRDFSAFTQKANDLNAFIKSKTEELDGLDNVGGSENLKSAMKDFMRYEKDLMEGSIIPFTKFGANTTDEEIQNAMENLKQKAQEENTYLDKVKKEQAEFASKNGFKIEGQK